MKYNLINKCAKISAFVVVASMIASCTAKFEEYNTNPYGPTQEDMIGDNASTGSLIRSMIPALAQGQQNNSQMLDQMIGSEFGGEITCIAMWGNGGNYYTYNPRIGWEICSTLPCRRFIPDSSRYVNFLKEEAWLTSGHRFLEWQLLCI